MKIFKYCDTCARELELPELAARRRDDCDNCGATHVICNHGDAKDKPKKKSKSAAKKKVAAKKPSSKAKPRVKAKSKSKKK